ncbi:MAG: 3'(2'),5'-bisphosphate nucleotidase CysQ [Alphaproteobacteria bacterium]|nr:3'(2'),5'-bisphosphate nucleotidase CysQ [Alphaproteobacteria bacterium]
MTPEGIPGAERDRLSRLFVDIASEAGIAVMDVYRSDFATRHKADRSPVSDADEPAEAIILDRLARDLPGVPVLAEEAASRDGLGGGLGDLFLLVDPVDGTREFVQKKGDFTVNIALVSHGRPVAGCVFAPAREELFFGGASAWAIDGFQPGGRVEASEARRLATRDYPDAGLTAVTSSSHLDARTEAFLAGQTLAGTMAIGSSLKFCLVASARADVYPRWGPTMEWDTAAGHAVLEAAGGCVLEPDGAPFLYGKDGFRNGPFIAWGRTPL